MQLWCALQNVCLYKCLKDNRHLRNWIGSPTLQRRVGCSYKAKNLGESRLKKQTKRAGFYLTINKNQLVLFAWLMAANHSTLSISDHSPDCSQASHYGAWVDRGKEQSSGVEFHFVDAAFFTRSICPFYSRPEISFFRLLWLSALPSKQWL